MQKNFNLSTDQLSKDPQLELALEVLELVIGDVYFDQGFDSSGFILESFLKLHIFLQPFFLSELCFLPLLKKELSNFSPKFQIYLFICSYATATLRKEKKTRQVINFR